MGFITRLFSRLRESSTWGAVSALAIGVGASQEQLELSAHTVAVGAALPTAVSRDMSTRSNTSYQRCRTILPRTAETAASVIVTGLFVPAILFFGRRPLDDGFHAVNQGAQRGHGFGVLLGGVLHGFGVLLAAVFLGSLQFSGPFGGGFAHPGEPLENQHGVDDHPDEGNAGVGETEPEGLSVGDVLGAQRGFLDS